MLLRSEISKRAPVTQSAHYAWWAAQTSRACDGARSVKVASRWAKAAGCFYLEPMAPPGEPGDPTRTPSDAAAGGLAHRDHTTRTPHDNPRASKRAERERSHTNKHRPKACAPARRGCHHLASALLITHTETHTPRRVRRAVVADRLAAAPLRHAAPPRAHTEDHQAPEDHHAPYRRPAGRQKACTPRGYHDRLSRRRSRKHAHTQRAAPHTARLKMPRDGGRGGAGRVRYSHAGKASERPPHPAPWLIYS